MQRLQAFRYEPCPNGQQQRDMRRFAGVCRFVFNKALAMQQEQHNTSRTCPCCAHVSANNRKTQAQFRCVQCGHEENADVVRDQCLKGGARPVSLRIGRKTRKGCSGSLGEAGVLVQA